MSKAGGDHTRSVPVAAADLPSEWTGDTMTASTRGRILDQRTPQERDRPFLPGAGRTWLLPFYDVLTRLAGLRALHRRAAGLAGAGPGQAEADVGSGTRYQA